MENSVTEGHQDNTHTNNVSKDKTVPYGVYVYGKKWGLPYIFRMVRYESVSIYSTSLIYIYIYVYLHILNLIPFFPILCHILILA